MSQFRDAGPRPPSKIQHFNSLQLKLFRVEKKSQPDSKESSQQSYSGQRGHKGVG